MSSSGRDRLVSRWLLTTAGIVGLVSFLIGASGVYFKLQGASNWQMPVLLGFWGLELALLIGAVSSLQALWSLLRQTADGTQFGFYVLRSVTGLVGMLTGMVAVIAGFLWFMSSRMSVLFGKVAALGAGITLVLAIWTAAKRSSA